MPDFTLSKHKGDEPVPSAQLAFVGRRLRNDLHHLVLDAFGKSGLTQAELARRMGADKGQVCRQLGAPGNWTIDTVGKLLFAINGSFVVVAAMDADAPALSNYTQPAWLQGRLPALPAMTEGVTSAIVTFSGGSSNAESRINYLGASPIEAENLPAVRIAAE